MFKKKEAPMAQPNWIIVGLLAAAAAVVFFLPFLGVICVSAIMAYMFYPLYIRLVKKMSPSLAAPLTMVISICVVVVPVVLVLVMAIAQGVTFANQIAESLGSVELQDTLAPALASANDALAPFNGGADVITTDGLIAFFREVLPAVLQFAGQIVLSLVNSVPVLLTSIILYGFLFNTFVRYADRIGEAVSMLSPFEDSFNQLYAQRTGSIVKASLGGQFLIAIVTAILSAGLLIFLGLGQYFIFFVIIFTLLGMVPLGAGVLMIPISIGAILLGDVIPGIWVLAIYLLVICQVDNFMRPRLIPKDAKLLPALTVLATFCGIYYFGLLGIIYGPVIAILLTTTLEIFGRYRQDIHIGVDLKKRRRA